MALGTCFKWYHYPNTFTFLSFKTWNTIKSWILKVLHFLYKTYCNAFLIWHLSTPPLINHAAWHCVKRVSIRSYSGPNFPAFGLNTERYGVSLRIQSECGKIRTRITPNTDTFYSVWKSLIILSMNLQSAFCSSKLGLHSNGYKVLWYLKSFLFFLL